jgi:putative effector of murein hydrolase
MITKIIYLIGYGFARLTDNKWLKWLAMPICFACYFTIFFITYIKILIEEYGRNKEINRDHKGK